MSFTVTATQGGTTVAGMMLRVGVVLGAAASQSGAAATDSGSLTTPEQPITASASGNRVYGAVSMFVGSSSTVFTAAANTALKANANDGTANDVAYAAYVSAAATTTSPATYGATAPAGSAGAISLAQLEIRISGTYSEHASTPAAVISGTLTALTTASFAPPAGSLLVLCVSTNGGPGLNPVMAISDTSGLGLTWTEASKISGANLAYAGVWLAVVPGASAGGSLTLTASAAAKAPAAASGALAITGTAGARAAAAGAGSITVAGTAVAAAPAAAAGLLAIAGTAAATAAAAASGAVALSGTGSAAAPVTAAGTLVLAGTAAATGPGPAAAGALDVAGTAAASAPATAAGAITFTGSAAGGGPPALRNAASSPAVTSPRDGAAAVTAGRTSASAVTGRAASSPATSDG